LSGLLLGVLLRKVSPDHASGACCLSSWPATFKTTQPSESGCCPLWPCLVIVVAEDITVAVPSQAHLGAAHATGEPPKH